MSQTAAARTTTRRTLRPASLTVTTANGETFTLNKRQLAHAATIITIGNRIYGVGRAGIKIALIAA